MINYAHRGASEYAPENTLSSFYLGLVCGANGIETDVQRTKDGTLILFHDDTVDRVSDGTGKIGDFTLEEAQNLKIYGNCKNGFYDRIITLEAFLEKFSQYDITFAIELKGENVEEDTLSMVKKYDMLDKTIFTSFHFTYIEKIKALDKMAKVGWLTENPDAEDVRRLLSIGGEEIAPQAKNITPALLEMCRGEGLGVRAWGVSDTVLMEKMCSLGVDGMTVNFPDKLNVFLQNA